MKQSTRVLRIGLEVVSRVMRWSAFASVVLLMMITGVSVVFRWFGYPVLGASELIEHTMIILIAFSLAYAQTQRAHISVDLVVNRLPARVRSGFDAVGGVLISATGFTIAWIYLQENVGKDTSASTSTGLLDLPTLPFKLVLALGFGAWGLNALLQVIDRRATHVRVDEPEAPRPQPEASR